MRAVIIGNGTIKDHGYIRSLIHDGGFVICADGGLRHAAAMGITADIAVGDLDSSDGSGAHETFVYPVRKDFTDGELAVRYALDNGYDDILLLGMIGTRLDHTLTNLTLMAKAKTARMSDENNDLYLLRGELEISGEKGRTLSIIPVFGDIGDITTEGLEYPLRGETLYFSDSRGNSNVITADTCRMKAGGAIDIVAVNGGE